jgi:hypothetical protein
VTKASSLFFGGSSSERSWNVKKRFFYNGVILLILSIVTISSLTFASDKDRIKMQGVVMELDLKNNMMVVNERMFVWDSNTIFYDEKGSPLTVNKLRAKTWVYIEGLRDNVRKRLVVEKIYMLPNYIHGKEKHLYPFME